MVTNGRLKGIVEQVRRQLASGSLGGSIHTFEGTSYHLDLLLASLSVRPHGQSGLPRAAIRVAQTL